VPAKAAATASALAVKNVSIQPERDLWETVAVCIALGNCDIIHVSSQGVRLMLLLAYYIVAITVLVLHFTGWLRQHNLEWLVLVLAVTVFPAVLWL